MTEADWEYTDEDGLKCSIVLFQNETDELTWKAGEITHEQVSGYGYQIAYDLIRELHAQKAEIEKSNQLVLDNAAKLLAQKAEIEAHAKLNLKLSLQSLRFADKHSELADKFVDQKAEIERYRSALESIKESHIYSHGPEHTQIMSDIATKALEDKQQ